MWATEIGWRRLVFLSFFSGFCVVAADGVSGADQESACDDPVIFGGPSSRVSDVVTLEHLALPAREEPRLVWHCGTPDPPPPPVEALSAGVRIAVTLRAPCVGETVVRESRRCRGVG